MLLIWSEACTGVVHAFIFSPITSSLNLFIFLALLLYLLLLCLSLFTHNIRIPSFRQIPIAKVGESVIASFGLSNSLTYMTQIRSHDH